MTFVSLLYERSLPHTHLPFPSTADEEQEALPGFHPQTQFVAWEIPNKMSSAFQYCNFWWWFKSTQHTQIMFHV
jgi:hypothetical protein